MVRSWTGCVPAIEEAACRTKELLNDKKELFDFTSYFYYLIIIAACS